MPSIMSISSITDFFNLVCIFLPNIKCSEALFSYTLTESMTNTCSLTMSCQIMCYICTILSAEWVLHPTLVICSSLVNKMTTATTLVLNCFKEAEKGVQSVDFLVF